MHFNSELRVRCSNDYSSLVHKEQRRVCKIEYQIITSQVQKPVHVWVLELNSEVDDHIGRIHIGNVNSNDLFSVEYGSINVDIIDLQEIGHQAGSIDWVGVYQESIALVVKANYSLVNLYPV